MPPEDPIGDLGEGRDRGLDQGPFLLNRNKGREHFEAHEYAQARSSLELAHRIHPDDPEVLYWLAMTYFRLDAHKQAEELFRQLIAVRPDVAALQVNRGIVLYKMERSDEAEEAFRRALALDGTANRPHLYLGLLEARRSDFRSALRHFRRAGAEVLAARMEARLREEKAQAGGDPSRSSEPAASPAGDGGEEGPAAPPDPATGEASVVGAGAADLERRFGAEPPGAPIRGEAIFRQHGKFLVQVSFPEELLVRQGALAGSAGELSFEASSEEGELLRARGEGEVFLVGEGRRISIIELSGDAPFHVEIDHFVACERRLRRELISLGRRNGLGIRMVALQGAGMVALATGGQPLVVPVRKDHPVSVSGDLLVGWHGELDATLVRQGGMEDRAIRGSGGALKLRFRGQGRLLLDHRREDGL